MFLLIINCLRCLYLKSWHQNTDIPPDDSQADDDKEGPSPKEDSDIDDSDLDQEYINVQMGECSGHKICCICKIVHWISAGSRSSAQLQTVSVSCV